MSAFRLSEEQHRAATSEESHMMIIAPPGCGKTEVLAHRAAHVLDSLEKDQRVLALTFTNRARSNLEERLRAVVGQIRLQRQIRVRNFHGFATEVVLAHGRTIGLDVKSLQLPRTNTLGNALRTVGASTADIYRAESLLKALKRKPISDVELLEELQARSSTTTSRLAERVERQRQETNQLHYEDLLRHAQRLLRIPAVARLYQTHYGAVLIDEFQDLTMQQLEIAELSCSSSQTFAGDPLQGIYSWAGAAPIEVEMEITKKCGKPVRLQESYRSSPKVLEAVNSLSEQIEPGSRLYSAQPERWVGAGSSAAITFKDRTDEAHRLRDLARMIMQRDPRASIGIICRAAWRQHEINQLFGSEEEFPVRRWGLAIDDPDVATLVQSIVVRLPKNTSIQDAKREALDAIEQADVDTLQQVEEAFATLEKSEATTARAALEAIKISDPDQAVGRGVHLLNAHQGKGQQFDWVFIIGLEEGHLPDRRNGTGEKLKEEERVLLVMLSRARHGLVLSKVRTTSGPYGPYKAKPSRWWSSIQTAFSSIEEIEKHELVGSPTVNA